LVVRNIFLSLHHQTIKHKAMLNYTKLMNANPTKYGEMVNSIGQKIEFVEHPTKGDEHPVIAVCHELQLAAATDFFELDDMTADHKEYEPSFQDGKLFIGDF
jgi:hypothetical protein